MATKTAKKPVNAKKDISKKTSAVLSETQMAYMETVCVEHGMIDPSPYQPRQDFSEAELQALADDIEKHGLMQALSVRKNRLGRFELLDGERRWRAHDMKPSIGEIRCDVYLCSDAEARKFALRSVLYRQDLNAIERANALQKMLDAGDYPGQKELAAAMGIEQGTVSNLLRLLRMPADWQRRIIAREMSERHARALLPYLKYPTIVAAIDAFLTTHLDAAEPLGLPSVHQWETVTVPGIVKDTCRPMDGVAGDRGYYHPRYGKTSIFEPDCFEEKKLEILQIDGADWATNVPLWEKLQQAHMEKLAQEKRDREAVAGDDAADIVTSDAEVSADDDASVEEWTMAKAEALVEKILNIYDRHLKEEIKLNRKEVEVCQEVRQYGYVVLMDSLTVDKALDIVETHGGENLQVPAAPHEEPESCENSHAQAPANHSCSPFFLWKMAWARKLIAEELTNASVDILSKIVTLGLTVWKVPQESLDTRLDEALRSVDSLNRKKSLTQNLLECQNFHLENVLAHLVVDWFFDADNGPANDVPYEDVTLLMDLLELDYAAEWANGNILALRALLDLYDVEGLVKLAAKWKVQVDAQWGHDGIANKLETVIGSDDHDTPLPAEVAKAKRK